MTTPEAAGRCLLVAQTFPPLMGGSAEVYAALARNAGGAIAVLTGSLDHQTGQVQPGWQALDAALPHPVRRLCLVRPPMAGSGLGWGARDALRLALAVAREARRHAADAVCVCDDETVGWLVPFVRHVLRRRALIYCHGDDLASDSPSSIRHRQRWFRFAHAVVAAGAHAAARLEHPYGVEPARILCLPNGVDLSRFQPHPADPALRARLGLDGRRVLIAPSRLVPRKGVDRLIQALPGIRARHPDVALLVVGDGPQRAALETLAAGLPVRFTGAVPPTAMAAHYALAEAMVLPNRAEAGEADGMPLVFLEAMACGLPVIGGRAGGTPEAVRHEETGLLVDGEDPAAIAAATLRLLEDAPLRARLAAAGLALARSRGWPAQTQRFLAACRGAPQRIP